MLEANSLLSQGVLLPEFISWRRKKKTFASSQVLRSEAGLSEHGLVGRKLFPGFMQPLSPKELQGLQIPSF